MRWSTLFGATAFAIGAFVAQAPLAAAITIGFSEAIDNSLTHITDEVDSSDRGVAGAIFEVDKFIHNTSTVAWHGFQMTLLVVKGGELVISDHFDGVSFNEAGMSDAEWAAAVKVDINGVDQGPNGGTWRAARRDPPFDQIDFFFNGFQIDPDDTLSLHFFMSDNADNVWRLQQFAMVPVPASLLFLGTGLAAFAGLRRKQLAS